MDELLFGKYAVVIAVGVGAVFAVAMILKQYSANASYAQVKTIAAKKKRNKKVGKKLEDMQFETLSRSLGGSTKKSNSKASGKSDKSSTQKSKKSDNKSPLVNKANNIKSVATISAASHASGKEEKEEMTADLDYTSFLTGENKKHESEMPELARVGRRASGAAKVVLQRAAGGLEVSHTEYISEYNEDEWTTVENTFKKKDNEVIRFSEFSYEKIMKNAKAQGLLTQSNPRVDIDKQLGTITIHGDPEVVAKAREGFNNIMTELQAYEDSKRSEVVKLGDKWYIVAGQKFENFKRIQDTTGARLNLEKETNDLTISGFHKQVDDAIIEVNLALNPPPPAHSIALPVTRHNIMAILGESGKTIKKIQAETGAKLELSGEKTDESRSLMISGDQKEIMAANAQVLAIIRDNGYEKVVPLTNNGVQLLFYNNGEPLKSLRNIAGTASIQVDRDAMKVTLIGEQKKVDELAQQVFMIINSPPKAPTLNDGEIFETIELGDHVAAVAGKGFSNVNVIKTKYGVNMDIPPTTTACWIWGNSKKVISAKSDIMELIKKMDDKKDKQAKSEEDRAKFMTHQNNASVEKLMKKDPSQQWGGSLPVGW